MRPGIAVALLLVLIASGCGGTTDVPVLPPGRAIDTSRALSPTAHLFADPVQARVEVVVDRRLLDPTRVRVTTAFEPYEKIGEERLTRRDLGKYTRLRYEYTLRCLTVECIPVRLESILGEQEEGRGERRTFRLPPAQVAYDDPSEGRILLRSVAWPPLTSVSRLNEAQGEAEFPFRATPQALPALAYLIPPPLFAGVLFLASLALLALPGRAGRRWWRERRRPPVEEQTVELRPLERALALVELACDRGDGADRRKALEVLAAELEQEGREGLAEQAREQAWERATPASVAALALVERLREDDGDSP